MGDPDLKCGYGCGAPATEDFLWPSDAEVWHVCARHAEALQRMLDAQGDAWATKVVRRPGGGRAPAEPTDDSPRTGRLGARLGSALSTMRDRLARRSPRA